MPGALEPLQDQEPAHGRHRAPLGDLHVHAQPAHPATGRDGIPCRRGLRGRGGRRRGVARRLAGRLHSPHPARGSGEPLGQRLGGDGRASGPGLLHHLGEGVGDREQEVDHLGGRSLPARPERADHVLGPVGDERDALLLHGGGHALQAVGVPEELVDDGRRILPGPARLLQAHQAGGEGVEVIARLGDEERQVFREVPVHRGCPARALRPRPGPSSPPRSRPRT